MAFGYHLDDVRDKFRDVIALAETEYGIGESYVRQLFEQAYADFNASQEIGED